MTGEVIYDTGNPVPSADAYDRHDNTRVFDGLLNGSDLTVTGRTGKQLKSWAGFGQQVTDFLIESAYESVYLTYGAGVVVERQTQLVQRDGELYRVVNASDIPLTLTGTWATDAPKLQAVGDVALRQALAAPGGSSLINDQLRTLEKRLGDVVSVKSLGAIGDDVYHPLSERYATLADAQAVYPFVTSLTQSIDWAACQKAVNTGGAVDFSGNPRSYVLSQTLVVSVNSTRLQLAGCAFSASPGFTSDLMISIPASGVRLIGGCTVDAANMAPITADFNPNSFRGFAIGSKGLFGAVITGLEVSGGAIIVRNAPAAAFGMQYCSDFHVSEIYGESCDNSATFVGPGVIYFNRCDRYSVDRVGAKDFKWKGLYNSNGNDFSVSTALCINGVADQAAIFFVTCTSFEANQLQTRNAFGIKYDKCTDFTTDGVLVRCSELGLVGVMVQGCVGFTLDRLFVDGYVTAGIEVSYHPGPPAANAVVGSISNFLVRNGGVSSDAGIRMFGSATELAGQLRIQGGYIYSCTSGIKVRNDGTGVLNRLLAIHGVTIDSFSLNGIEGIAEESSYKGVEFYNPGASAEGCIVVFQRTGQTAKTLAIENCSAPALPAAVPFIACTPLGSRHIMLGDMAVVGNNVRGGTRLLNLSMTQVGDYLNTLLMSGNTHNGAATTTSVGLSNTTGTGTTQVCLTGNMLLTAALAKANINFVEAAATGRWNGVAANNMAGVLNQPNNV